MENINFEPLVLRLEVTGRGGGVEIDLEPLGFAKGDKMAAYQNYLGGGMLGRIGVNDTINSSSPFVEVSASEQLKEIGEQLKRYYFEMSLTGGSYEENQRLPISAY